MDVNELPGVQAPAAPAAEQRGLPPGRRGLRLAAEPTYSIVLASTQPRAVLEARLPALAGQCRDLGIELVVARGTAASELHELAAAFPYPLFMPAPDGSTTRQLRAIGITAADGDVVAFLEDDRDVPAGWVADAFGKSAPADG